MRLLSFLSILALAGALVPTAEASKPRLRQGQATFDFHAAYIGKPTLDKPIRLRIEFHSDVKATGTIRVDVPDGIEVIEGDLARKVEPHLREHWDLYLRPMRPGTYVLRGHYMAQAESHVDEGEWIVRWNVYPDRLDAELCESVRYERVENGQRYRYGGWFLVPIDEPEDFTYRTIRRAGQKPQLHSATSPSCDECEDAGQRLPGCYVLVNRDGQVVDVRIPRTVDGDALSEFAATALREAALQWRFSPATVRARPVADWVYVEFPEQ